MRLDEIRAIADRITYGKRGWTVRVRQDQDSERPYIQVHYDGTGMYGDTEWTGRKWPLSQFMTETEIVHTAFKAVLAAEEHESRELFLYEGVAICGPHYSVRDIVTLVQEQRLHHDVRADAMQGAT